MYILDNILTNGSKESGLIIISMLSIISGILVIVSKNPVRSVLFLIGLFITIAIYLFALNISFIALAYLLVYVGAVSILFLFILMLINVRISELVTNNNNSIPLSIIIIVIFSVVFSSKSFFFVNNSNLFLLLDNNLKLLEDKTDVESTENLLKSDSLAKIFLAKETNENVYLVFSSMWDNILGEVSHITTLGNILYTSHSLGIIVIGLILLLSMIGAISVTAVSNKE